MDLILSSQSPEDTFGIGKTLGEQLKGNELIFLFGNLGAGKTILSKGIGHALGIDRREIVSPSYTLMNIYDGKFKLYHIDLYRIGENISGGVPEIDDNLDTGIIIVEWADYIKDFYLNEVNLIEIKITHSESDYNKRSISISTEKELSLP